MNPVFELIIIIILSLLFTGGAYFLLTDYEINDNTYFIGFLFVFLSMFILWCVIRGFFIINKYGCDVKTKTVESLQKENNSLEQRIKLGEDKEKEEYRSLLEKYEKLKDEKKELEFYLSQVKEELDKAKDVTTKYQNDLVYQVSDLTKQLRKATEEKNKLNLSLDEIKKQLEECFLTSKLVKEDPQGSELKPKITPEIEFKENSEKGYDLNQDKPKSWFSLF